MPEPKYTPADLDLYLHVLRTVEPMSCLAGGALVSDPELFQRACFEAAHAVPMTISSLTNKHIAKREIGERLQEAVAFRNKFYRDNLKPVGRVQ